MGSPFAIWSNHALFQRPYASQSIFADYSASVGGCTSHSVQLHLIWHPFSSQALGKKSATVLVCRLLSLLSSSLSSYVTVLVELRPRPSRTLQASLPFHLRLNHPLLISVASWLTLPPHGQRSRRRRRCTLCCCASGTSVLCATINISTIPTVGCHFDKSQPHVHRLYSVCGRRMRYTIVCLHNSNCSRADTKVARGWSH